MGKEKKSKSKPKSIEADIDTLLESKIFNKIHDNQDEEKNEQPHSEKEKDSLHESDSCDEKIKDENVNYGIANEYDINTENKEFLESEAKRLYKEISKRLNNLRPDI